MTRRLVAKVMLQLRMLRYAMFRSKVGPKRSDNCVSIPGSRKRARQHRAVCRPKRTCDMGQGAGKMNSSLFVIVFGLNGCCNGVVFAVRRRVGLDIFTTAGTVGTVVAFDRCRDARVSRGRQTCREILAVSNSGNPAPSCQCCAQALSISVHDLPSSPSHVLLKVIFRLVMAHELVGIGRWTLDLGLVFSSPVLASGRRRLLESFLLRSVGVTDLDDVFSAIGSGKRCIVEVVDDSLADIASLKTITTNQTFGQKNCSLYPPCKADTTP